jgi:protein phosphatase PTC2/3
VHHNFEDSGDDYDLEPSSSFGSNRHGGRIILLGDGTEVLTDSDDTEMFDHEEDKDLDSQVSRGTSATTASKSDDSSKGNREATPGPPSKSDDKPIAASSISAEPKETKDDETLEKKA